MNIPHSPHNDVTIDMEPPPYDVISPPPYDVMPPPPLYEQRSCGVVQFHTNSEFPDSEPPKYEDIV